MNRKLAWIISLGTLGVLAMFFIYPAGMVVKQAFEGTGADGEKVWTLDCILAVFSNPIYREGLWNALMMGVVSTALTLLIAFPLALVAHQRVANGFELTMLPRTRRPRSFDLPTGWLEGADPPGACR